MIDTCLHHIGLNICNNYWQTMSLYYRVNQRLYNYLTVYILFRGTFVTQSLWRNKQMEQITYKILIAYLYNYEFGLSLCTVLGH
jgi:hypothetical protein